MSPLYAELKREAEAAGMECFVNHVDATRRDDHGFTTLDVKLEVFGTIELEAAFRRKLTDLGIQVYEIEHRRHDALDRQRD
jgi:tRNA(Ser,Leu) C12 N-acetylase TAN1